MVLLRSEVVIPLMKLPVLSTLIEVGDRRILVSPGSNLSEQDYLSLGNVTDLVAPNLLHTAGMLKAHQFFPEAELWGVPGVREAKPQIPWTKILGEDTWPYKSQLPFVKVEGMPSYDEFVFLDKQSKSLLVTDLLFNLQDRKGLLVGLLLRMLGTYKRLAVSRLFASKIKDQHAFTVSMVQILLWDFTSIYMSHGEPVLQDAKAKMRAALQARGFQV